MKKQNELVSVIVPIYNGKQYLMQCIDNIVRQTYENLEIILVDDGSTDDSGSLCDELASKDSRMKVIHQENRGVSGARNAGLSLSNGTYIIFTDCDDYLEKNAIELLVPIMEKDRLDMLIFGGASFFEDGVDEELRARYESAYKRTREEYPVLNGAKLYALLERDGEYSSNVNVYIYRNSFLRQCGLTFKEGIIHEDELFSILAYYNAQSASCFNRTLYHRLLRPGSIITEVAQDQKLRMRSFECIVWELLKELEKSFEKHKMSVESGRYSKKLSYEKVSMLKAGFSRCLWHYLCIWQDLDCREKVYFSARYHGLRRRLLKRRYYYSNRIFICVAKNSFPLLQLRMVKSRLRK